MNRLALFIILASPTVAASWMLLPRFYSNLFGPSLFDTMFVTPSLLPSSSTTGTMVPKVTESNSLWNKLMDESKQMQQRMMSLSTNYEYMNYDRNITIRTHVPPSMTFENVQVQYDEPNQLLWIRGSNDKNEVVNTNNGESTTTKSDPSSQGKNDVPVTTKKSMSHYEFTQTFALDPNVVNVEHLMASYDDNTKVLTVVVPKYEQIDANQKKPAIRTIPIATTTTTSADTASLNGATMNTTTTTTTAPSEVNEPVMTH